MTRRTATGRLDARPSGRRKPAHLAPRKPLLQQAVPAAVATGISGGAASLSKFGLAAVLGSALVTASQLPAGAAGGTAQTSAPKAAAPVAVSGAPLTSGTGTVVLDSVALTAATTPKAAAAPKTTALSAAMISAARRAHVITVARKYVGTRYVWGGTRPRPGFDCSGYTGYVFKLAGKTLPRTSRQQYAHVRRISRASARPGDLVFFHSSSGRVFHVGIYAGGNKMYDSPRPGRRVGLHTIWSSRVTFGRAI